MSELFQSSEPSLAPTSEISKAYTPGDVEEVWYDRWRAAGCFTADSSSAAPAYSLVIPPPNVTGLLTLGHVLNNTLQDILARRARHGVRGFWTIQPGRRADIHVSLGHDPARESRRGEGQE